MGTRGNTGDDSDELGRIHDLASDMARLEALQLQAIASFGRQRSDLREAAAELALVLSIGENVARKKLELANALVTRLPNTLAAMENGVIDGYKASKVAEPTTWMSDEQAHQVDALVAPKLEGRDASWIRRATTAAVHRVDSDGAATRARRRRTERRVELLHGDDGMATLLADLPAEVASAAYARIDRHAHTLRGNGEPRTLDQLRADVFADILLGRTRPTTSAKAEVFVYADLVTLMGLRDNPAELAGHGPISAQVARDIAFDVRSTWRRIITDPLDGAPVDVGRQRYRPPAVTADYARVRDRECRFPACHRPSWFGDLDHVTDWARHGRTDANNLVGLCRKHHRLKDAPGWTYRLNDATHHFTVCTPSGRTYTTAPPPLHDPTPPPF